MYILGINISHHCSVCLIKDGEIVFFLEEERLSKIKHHYPFVLLKEKWYLGLSSENNNDHLGSDLQLLTILEASKITNKIDHLIFSSYGDETDGFIMDIFLEQLSKIFTIKEKHFYQEHHLYHACSTFYNSGFSRALSLILDGGGYICSKNLKDHEFDKNELKFHEQESIYLIDYENITPILKHYARNEYLPSNGKTVSIKSKRNNAKEIFSNSLSCGGVFNVVSHIIGFDGSTAGKTMGLAAYGNDKTVEEDWFVYDKKNDIWITDIESIYKSLSMISTLPFSVTELFVPDGVRKVTEQRAADLAKKAQVETRDHTIRLIDKFTKETGEKNVVLSGGYFLNCSNNYEYLKRFPNLNFFIDPIAHDGGTAIGAAKYLWHKLTGDTAMRKLETLYLG